ncbi:MULTISPECIES: YraN family protein [Tatumella]|uniref:UPF0102 protein ACFP73_02570 n=1 Tax=Tatumella punctata TaxID=399969 RepID=A0ABW1VIP5_9GAMM|nr:MULTISPECIES: YraN family protein [unclassified Tatumella]MBS0855210.1 YraN family protein [Tatumella sp. JGM16]MBS0876762.1 YraN family protein [Tatumella sp. JGM82]MBS0889813.1 YraN family protein [Tatumella sp. JGM94]MBS0892891.1 YraN family protein [Tatumella sp. JGM130]MBS0901517.1 YraN family protein [Tatumella sp. JGM100]
MEPIFSGANYTGTLNRIINGQLYERRARRFLQRAGLKWVASNVRYPCGEIDLIMRDGMIWVFTEVRFRSNDRFGGALASITRQKRQRLRKAAALWLAGRQQSFATTDCRFDIIAVTGKELQWLKNAFDTDM